MRASLSCVYRFGDFALDVETGELRKRGLKLKIQGQPLEILAMLLEQPGKVVTREEFQSKLWMWRQEKLLRIDWEFVERVERAIQGGSSEEEVKS